MCLFVSLSVCGSHFSHKHINILAKWNQNFMKLPAYFRIVLPSWLIMFLHMHVCVYTQSMKNMHPTFVSFLLLFCQFFFCNFEAFTVRKWKKNGGHTPGRFRLRKKYYKIKKFWQLGIIVTQLFCFVYFFQSGSLPKWPKLAQKWSKYHVLPLVAKIYNFGKKVIK